MIFEPVAMECFGPFQAFAGKVRRSAGLEPAGPAEPDPLQPACQGAARRLLRRSLRDKIPCRGN